jgi:hypothetical protein
MIALAGCSSRSFSKNGDEAASLETITLIPGHLWYHGATPYQKEVRDAAIIQEVGEGAAGMKEIGDGIWSVHFGRCSWASAMNTDGSSRAPMPITSPYGGRAHSRVWPAGRANDRGHSTGAGSHGATDPGRRDDPAPIRSSRLSIWVSRQRFKLVTYVPGLTVTRVPGCSSS